MLVELPESPWVGAFRCTRVEVSPVAAVAVVERRDESADSDPSPPRPLVDLLRFVRDLLVRLRRPVPLVALVISKDRSQREAVERWAGDQDWHRGEFVLRACAIEKMQETCDGILAPATALRRQAAQFAEQMDVRDWARGLRERLPGQEPEVAALGLAVALELEQGIEGQHLQGWLDQQLEQAAEAAQEAEPPIEQDGRNEEDPEARAQLDTEVESAASFVDRMPSTRAAIEVEPQ